MREGEARLCLPMPGRLVRDGLPGRLLLLTLNLRRFPLRKELLDLPFAAGQILGRPLLGLSAGRIGERVVHMILPICTPDPCRASTPGQSRDQCDVVNLSALSGTIDGV